jgi:hypothetical protein
MRGKRSPIRPRATEEDVSTPLIRLPWRHQVDTFPSASHVAVKQPSTQFRWPRSKTSGRDSDLVRQSVAYTEIGHNGSPTKVTGQAT